MSTNVTKMRVKGVTYTLNGKLYDTTGSNTDGSMTQASITSELNDVQGAIDELVFGDRFFIRSVPSAYQNTVADCYIDKSKLSNIEHLYCWSYNNRLYIRFDDGTETHNLIQSLSFEDIENYKPIIISYNEDEIGYIVIKDKDLFSSLSDGSLREMNLDLVLNDKFHGWDKILDNKVSTLDTLINEVETNVDYLNNSFDAIVDDEEESKWNGNPDNTHNNTLGYGWGLTLAENVSIVKVKINVKAANVEEVITKCQLILSKDDYPRGVLDTYVSGSSESKLAVKTINNLAIGSNYEDVEFEFDKPISYNGLIYAFFRCDVKASYKFINDISSYKFLPADGVSFPRNTYIANGWDGFCQLASIGTSYILNTEITTIDTTLSSNIINNIKDKIGIEDIEANIEAFVNENVIDVNLPDNIYAVVGDTLQLFFRGIVKAKNPYNYDIRVSCLKGMQYQRYFEYTPRLSDVSSTPISFKIDVRNNNGISLGSKTCNLTTVSAPHSPQQEINVLTFGDSLTANGIWCNELNRRLTNNNSVDGIIGNGLTNINLCGSKTITRDGTTTKFFGVGGWTWNEYTSKGRPAFRFQVSGVTYISYGVVYTNNGHNYTVVESNITNGIGNILCTTDSVNSTPLSSGTLTKVSESGGSDSTITFSSVEADVSNPLWDTNNNKMSFIPYANSYCNNQIDVVYVLLSWNGLSPYMTNFDGILARIRIFANALHLEFPNAKLKLLGVQIPNVIDTHTYGATGENDMYSYSDAYGITISALNMNKAYQELANESDYSAFVEFVNVSAQFDSENNMPTSNKAVNIRNTETEKIGSNGVHPTDNGYCQIADVVYRNFVKEFCQI